MYVYNNIICERVWEKGPYGAKIEIEIWAPEVSHRKNSFFLQFLFFAELVLVIFTLRLCQISKQLKRPHGCGGKTSYFLFSLFLAVQ